METTKEIGFFEQFKIACTSPRRYKELSSVKKGYVIVFFLIITFLTTVLGFGMDVLGFGITVGGPKNFIMNRLPDFQLKNGQLDMKDSMDFNLLGVHIVADTNKKLVDDDDFDDKYVSEILFAKKNMYVKADAVTKIHTEVKFDDYKNVTFDNQSLLQLMPMVYILLAILFFAVWVQNSIVYLLISAMIALFVRMNFRMQGTNVAFMKVFKLAIYSRVIFEIAETIGITAGWTFFVGILWTFISYMGSYFLIMSGLGELKIPKVKKEE